MSLWVIPPKNPWGSRKFCEGGGGNTANGIKYGNLTLVIILWTAWTNCDNFIYEPYIFSKWTKCDLILFFFWGLQMFYLFFRSQYYVVCDAKYVFLLVFWGGLFERNFYLQALYTARYSRKAYPGFTNTVFNRHLIFVGPYNNCAYWDISGGTWNRVTDTILVVRIKKLEQQQVKKRLLSCVPYFHSVCWYSRRPCVSHNADLNGPCRHARYWHWQDDRNTVTSCRFSKPCVNQHFPIYNPGPVHT